MARPYLLFVLLLAVSFGSIPAARPAGAQQAEHETIRIDDGVYMFRYRSHNSMFIVTGEGVIAFDPISVEAARLYKEEIARITSQPVRLIVYSHHHADHITGAAELASGVPIVAHEICYERLAAEPSPDILLPTRTFTDRMTLHMGGKVVRFLYLGRNHSDNSIVAHLPDQGLIFAVDFVANDRVAYRDLPGFYLPDLWLSLERLQQIDYHTAVFGHGEPGGKSDVYEQIAYWTDLRRVVESLIRAGLSEDEAVEAIELPAYEDWGGYDEWFKMNARVVYRYYADRRQ
ncbi:MAG: MBL fold metallo-hydrolase [Gemmatimonadetes bacterium]|uniref:MBL fold metallo-hydrolase n=1 Tax=Candidatus Kutchimonas denitrificans TaxID=3056748 RepID=A0AAE4ZB18_9BACT|nr:MBL fold metallo-hydrolase [Gemmatimonadota bacterium]NIR74831.1 MBL fold metallo-hydrolase [Candidatus Kutchimonas denitrificans]NIR99942.1 MBL fold metallo-hydrolase [Gemmatimonadota bacterium]NIT65526.1 MBL fold metallo-hydrolase [Gemmatimonadota bacterium]NIU52496.1 MBL fold metallo-hydrolase [Gemmatimonadota bacterium]